MNLCDNISWGFLKDYTVRNNLHAVEDLKAEITGAVESIFLGNTGCSYVKFNLTSANDMGYVGSDMILYE
jgi:hypothetical protein